MGERFDGQLVRETPSRKATAIRHSWFAMSMALLPVFGLGPGRLPESVLLVCALAWFPLSFAMVPLIRHFAKTPERRPVRVRIDDEGLHVDGKQVLERSWLHSGGTYTSKSGEVRVVFKGRRRVVSVFRRAFAAAFLVDHAAQGDALLAAAGLDAQRNVFRVTFLRPQGLWQVVFALVVYVALSVCFFKLQRALFHVSLNPVLGTIPVLFAGAGALGVYALLARTTVTVGNDGIEIRRALRRRFVRLDEIRNVRAAQKALVITLASGKELHLANAAPIAEPVGNFGASDIGMERRLLADRIVDAMRAHGQRDPDGNALVALRRAERSPDAWFAALQAVGAGAGSYRTRSVTVDELRRTVTDTTAAGDVRVGAAVALRIAGDDGAAERIRIAAGATAAPELRSLLEEIAGAGDDAELRRHFERQG